MSDLLSSDFDSLIRRVWITKGCRFNCHARLLREHKLKQVLLSFLSLAVIVVSLLSLLGHGKLTAQEASAFTLVLSIAILMMGLLDAQEDSAVLAERMHRSALELLELYNDLLVFRGDEQKMREGFEAYAEIQKRFIDNHHEIDYLRFKIEKHKEFNNGLIEKAYWIARYLFLTSRRQVYPNYLVILIMGLVAYVEVWGFDVFLEIE